MTPGLGFALVAMLGFGVSDLIYKRGAAAGIKAGEFIMLQAWVFCPSMTLYAWLTGRLDLRAAALWGALAGAFLSVAMYNFAMSLRGGAVSTNAPIFRLNFTLTAALAIFFLGETITVTKCAALLCALIAVWLLLHEPTSKLKPMSAGSLIRILIATAAMALTNLFYKVGLQHGTLPESMVVAQAWVFCPTATALGWLEKRRFNPTPGGWRYPSLAALALAVAFVSLMHGLALGPASVLVPVAQMGFVFTALIGVTMFGERLNFRKGTGLVVAIVALALFAVS
jgi:uncharacterized membrane protein